MVGLTPKSGNWGGAGIEQDYEYGVRGTGYGVTLRSLRPPVTTAFLNCRRYFPSMTENGVNDYLWLVVAVKQRILYQSDYFSMEKPISHPAYPTPTAPWTPPRTEMAIGSMSPGYDWHIWWQGATQNQSTAAILFPNLDMTAALWGVG